MPPEQPNEAALRGNGSPTGGKSSRSLNGTIQELTAGQARWAHYSTSGNAEIDVKDEDVFVSDDEGFDTKNEERSALIEQEASLSSLRPSGKYGETEEVTEINKMEDDLSAASEGSDDYQVSGILTRPPPLVSDDDNGNDHGNENSNGNDNDDDTIEEPPSEQESVSVPELKNYHKHMISSIPESKSVRALTILPFSLQDRAFERTNDDNDTIVTGYSQETLQIRNTTRPDLDNMSVMTGHSAMTEVVNNSKIKRTHRTGSRLPVSPLRESALPSMATTTSTTAARRRSNVMLLPVDAHGTAMSATVLKEQWARTGKCVECGQTQTHLKVKHGFLKMFRKLEPQTVEGRVYKGYCLYCHDAPELRRLLNDDTIPLDLRRDEHCDLLTTSLRSIVSGVFPDGTTQMTSKKSPISMICSSWKVQVCFVLSLVLALGAGIGLAIMFSLAPQPFVAPPPTSSPSLSPSTAYPSASPTSYEWVFVGDIDGNGTESFGYNIIFDRSGTLVAVSSPNAGSGSGQVDVFQVATSTMESETWKRYGQSLSGDNFDQMGLGMYLSPDGSTLGIGYPGNGNGFVRVFRLIQNVWVQLGQTLYGPSVGSAFGFSLSLNLKGNILIVGAPQHIDTDGKQVGFAQVYNFTGKEWEPMGQQLTAGSENDRFGHVVTLDDSGLLVCVSAPEGDGRWSNGGQVYTYKFDSNALYWGTYVKIPIWGIHPNSHFGQSMKMTPNGQSFVSAETLAPSETGLEAAGLVRVLAFDVDFATASDSGFGAEGDETGLELGICVDMSDGSTDIAASSKNKEFESGLVRMFAFDETGVWLQASNDIGPLPLGDRTWLGKGPSVAMIDRDRVAVGYESVRMNGKSKSLVRIFRHMGATAGFPQRQMMLRN